LSSIPRKRLTARPQTREQAPALALRRASDSRSERRAPCGKLSSLSCF
jgi:hypothetical protein